MCSIPQKIQIFITFIVEYPIFICNVVHFRYCVLIRSQRIHNVKMFIESKNIRIIFKRGLAVSRA